MMIGNPLTKAKPTPLLLLCALCLLVQQQQLVESSFRFDQAALAGPQQQAFDYYVSGRANSNQQQVDENASPVHLVEGLDYLPLQLDSVGAQNLAYLIEQLNPSAALAATNQQRQQQQPLEEEEIKADESNDILDNDDEPVKISAPINDPFEFAEQANNNVSQAAPNGAVLTARLGEVLRELYRRQEADTEQHDNDQLVLSAPTTGEPMDQQFDDEGDQQQQTTGRSASTTTSASRYGGGEYIDHPLALIGHQYVQGGAGEGRQLLGPDGAFENVQVVKTDHAVPSYCDPPNPCPIGYSAEDGCLEKFVNSASFSREYQAKQQCSCDNEHSLFNCAAPISTLKSPDYSATSSPSSTNNNIEQSESNTDNADAGRHHDSGSLEALARTIQNRFGNLDSVRNVIANYKGVAPEEHNLPEKLSSVSKKAYKVDTDFKY